MVEDSLCVEGVCHNKLPPRPSEHCLGLGLGEEVMAVKLNTYHDKILHVERDRSSRSPHARLIKGGGGGWMK